MTRTLYTCLGSGNAYKAELMLHLLQLDYIPVKVNIPKGENLRPAFRAVTPFAQIPVLVDEGRTYTDSQAILCYLARQYGGAAADRWLPVDADGLARVMRWLSVAANEIHNSLTLARAIKRRGFARNYDGAVERSYKLLALMDAHLTEREWLATDNATVADIACYPYILMAEEGGIDTAPFAAVTAWLRRLESVEHFWPMERIRGLEPVELVAYRPEP